MWCINNSNFVEPFIPYAVRLVATICDLTVLVFNRTVYTQQGNYHVAYDDSYPVFAPNAFNSQKQGLLLQLSLVLSVSPIIWPLSHLTLEMK